MLSVAKKYHLRYSPNYFVTLFKQPETWKQHILEGNIAGYDVMVYDLHEKYDSDELGISSSDLDMGRNKNLWITKTVILKDHNQIFSQTGRVSVAKIINILANIQ